MRLAALLGLLVIVLVGCTRKPTTAIVPADDGPPGPAWFEDVTDRVGINFTRDCGPTGTYFMPQSVGSGGALFDYDGDGRLDLYLVQNAGPKSKATNRLYHQKADGTFEDVSAGSGLDVAGHGMGVAVGDINNDGKPDLVLTEYGRTRLFVNAGGGKFTDVSEAAEIRNPLWGTSAAFFDFDRDGWLDLFVANYVDYDPSWDCTSAAGVKDFCAPKVFADTASKLFRNLGTQTGGSVKFEDISVKSGIGRVIGPGLGVAPFDADGDGWPDVFVANDGKPNRLWMNQKNGTFKDEAVSRGVAYTQMGQAYAGMGIALGDYDGDGLLDLYVSHLTSETNTLWKQGPRGQFTDQTAASDLMRTRWRGTGFGTLFADFDHNGHADLAVVNGRVQRGGKATGTDLSPFWETYAERNQVFSNTGGKFTEVSSNADPFSGLFNVARGLIAGDVDNDGAIDLVVIPIEGRVRVFRNVAPDRGHWLQVRALDPKLNRDAYGTEITIRAADRSWVRLVNPADSYLCSSSPVVHIGLGSATAVDRVDVLWPDGTRETFPGGAADRRMVLSKGSGKVQ